MPKIITDSVSDIPSEVAKRLGITIIPLNIQFGNDSFRDGVDLDRNEFYYRLQSSSILLACPQ